MSLQLSCFLAATLFLECFMLHASWSFTPQLTSFKSSLLFPLKSLKSSPNSIFSSKLAHHRSFAGKPFFPSRLQCLLFARQGHTLKKSWRRDSIPLTSEKFTRVMHYLSRPRCLDLNQSSLIGKTDSKTFLPDLK